MAQVQKVVLSCPEVEGLICPFTGKPLTVVAHIHEGVTTYSAPDAFHLGAPVKTIQELYRRASMRNGITGLVPDDHINIDPYSGEPFSLVKTSQGTFYFDGGWNPTYPCLSLAECVKRLSAGKRVLGTAPKAQSVEQVGDMTPDDSGAAHTVVDEETEKAADQIVKMIPGANRRTTVGYRQARHK